MAVDYLYWAFTLIPIILIILLFWFLFRLNKNWKKRIEKNTYEQEYIKEKARLQARKEKK